VAKAWGALVSSVHPNGKLGYVQKIGDKPGVVYFDSTEAYGVGAFLLAGSELYKLMVEKKFDKGLIKLTTTGSVESTDILELDYDFLIKKLPVDFVKKKNKRQATTHISPQTFILKDALTGAQIPYQLAFDNRQQLLRVLIQPALQPGALRYYLIENGTPDSIVTKVSGRQVPERYDDFAWENDRIAFHMYGKALEKEGDVSSGIDVWSKRTGQLVIDQWYKINA